MNNKQDNDFARLVGKVEPINKPDTAPSFGHQPPSRIHIKRHARLRDPLNYRATTTLRHNFERISPLLFAQMCQDRAYCHEHIDLHGMLVNNALNYLDDLIDNRRNRRLECWRIVHGKGRRSPSYDRAPLKHSVLERLLNHPAVAAIAAVTDKDGASGAVIIAILPQ